MPKTAIHKNRELEFWENEIWFAEDFLIPLPAGDAMSSENFCQCDFRVLVAMSANPAHHL